MSLEELNKNIYEKETPHPAHEESKFDPWAKLKDDPNILREKEKKQWVKVEDSTAKDRKKAIKIGAIILGSLVFILLVFLGINVMKKWAFNEGKVEVLIEGTTAANSNQAYVYRIIVKNNNHVDLKNAVLSLNYSENFVPQEINGLKIENQANSRVEIGEIKSNSQSEYELSGSFYAPQDFIVYLNAALNYSPSNSRLEYKIKNQLGISIKNSPITLELAGPQESASGDQAEYVITYKNNGNQIFNDIRIKIDYPENFSFVSSDPQTDESNNLWYIGNMSGGQEGKIVTRGIIQGLGGEVKTATASVGIRSYDGQFVVYNQKQAVTKIMETPLAIVQEVSNKSDSVNTGEKVSYKISYKNQGVIGLRNVVVVFEIDSNIFDFSSLEIEKNGYFNSVDKTITWRASEVPGLAALEPGQSGILKVSIPILENISIAKKSDKNFRIITTAKIDSPDIPSPVGKNKTAVSNRMELKLNSKLILSETGLYYDQNINNSGPIPPKVGNETTYTLRWKVINVSNDISNVKVTSSLPSGVRWTGKVYPENEKIEYNERTNEIIWQIGKLDNAIGILEPAREVAFQVAINPQPNQVNSLVRLINPAILTATDLFTNNELKYQVEEKSTDLYEDPAINGYKVVQ